MLVAGVEFGKLPWMTRAETIASVAPARDAMLSQ